MYSLEAFLGSMGLVTSPVSGSVSRLGVDEVRIYLDLLLHAYPRTNHRLGSPTLLRPLFATRTVLGSVRPPEGEQPLALTGWVGRAHCGTGISTGCASTTPFGLALAPDSPWED